MPDVLETANSTEAPVAAPFFEALTIQESLEALQGMLDDRMKALPTCLRDARKIPYHPLTGSEAKANDPRTFGTFDQAVARLSSGLRVQGEADYLGLGVYLGERGNTNRIVCIDLDWKKFRGTLVDGIPACVQALIEMMDSYTEISQSGLGVHIFVIGTLPEVRRKVLQLEEGVGMEVYSELRYVALTGNVIHNTELNERQEQLDALYESHLQRKVAPGAAERLASTETLTDAVVLQQIDRARNSRDKDFGLLFDGATHSDPKVSGNSSAMDYALASRLAWWMYPADIAGAMRASALYRGNTIGEDGVPVAGKWDSIRGVTDQGEPQTYLELTIRNAVSAQQDPYLGQPERTGAARQKPSTPSVDTETVQQRYAEIRPLMLEAVTTLRGSAAGRHKYALLTDGLLDLIRDGQFVMDGSDIRLLSGGLDGLCALIGGDRGSCGERLEFLAMQGMIGGIRRPERRGDSVQVLMPQDPRTLIALRQEGLLAGSTMPVLTSTRRAAERRARQVAGGTTPARKPVERRAPRPSTLSRARYIAYSAFCRHTATIAELASDTRESVATARRCVRMLLDCEYLTRLPERRLMATSGAAERFAADLAVELDRARRAPAERHLRRRIRYCQRELERNGESAWNDRLQDAEARLALLLAGESVRLCLAA